MEGNLTEVSAVCREPTPGMVSRTSGCFRLGRGRAITVLSPYRKLTWRLSAYPGSSPGLSFPTQGKERVIPASEVAPLWLVEGVGSWWFCSRYFCCFLESFSIQFSKCVLNTSHPGTLLGTAGEHRTKTLPQDTDKLWERREWKVKAQRNTNEENSCCYSRTKRVCELTEERKITFDLYGI